MSRRAFDFEFAFGKRERRSTAWKVVVPRRSSDVYLSNLDGDGEFHVRLHERGRCHVKMGARRDVGEGRGPWGGRKMVVTDAPSYLVGAAPAGYGEYLDMWSPKELAPGITMPFRVGIATCQLRLLPLEVADRPQVHYVAVSQCAEWFNEVAFFVTEGDGTAWPGRVSMGTSLLAKHRLPDDRFLWLTSRSHVMSCEDVMWTHAYRPTVSPSPEVAEVNREKEDLSTLVFARDEAYGSFAIWETGE